MMTITRIDDHYRLSANDEDRAAIRTHFETQGWELSDETWLREHLQGMAKRGYENQVSAVVAELLLRGKVD